MPGISARTRYQNCMAPHAIGINHRVSRPYRCIRFTNAYFVYVQPSSDKLNSFRCWLNLKIDYGPIERNSFSVFCRFRTIECVQSLDVQSEHMAILRVERYGLNALDCAKTAKDAEGISLNR